MLGRLGSKKPRTGVFSQRSGEVEEGLTRRQRWGQRALALVACGILAALITKPAKLDTGIPEDIDRSVVAGEEIRAAFSFETVDLRATGEARTAAAEKVPLYYRVDRERVRQQMRELRQRIELVESQRTAVQEAVLAALQNSSPEQTVEEITAKAVMNFAAKLAEAPEWETMPEAPVLAVWLKPDPDSLPDRQSAEGGAVSAPGEGGRPETALKPETYQPFRFNTGNQLRDLALGSLEYVLTEGIRPESLPTPNANQKIVILRDDPLADQQVSSEVLLAEVPDPVQAVEDLLNARLLDITKRVARETVEPTEWAKLHDAALPMVKPGVVDTIRYDRVSTEGARERAMESIAPVMKEIAAGEIIQDRGKRWTAESRSDVRTYLSLLQKEERTTQRLVSLLAGHALLAGLVLLCLYRSAGLLEEGPSEGARQHLYLALLLMCATLLVGRLASFFEPSGFAVPIAAVGILFAILVNVRMGAMVSVLTALLLSVQYKYDWRLLVVGSAMSLAGVFSIYKVRRRSDMAAASLTAAAVGLVAMAAITLTMDSLWSEAALRRMLLMALNGGVCLLLVPGLLPPLERLFGITTDIQLLEYSDLNNDVLSELAIKAPATYAHSLMLGQLAEAAADAIGANGLMARVCAYYHDIGKMRRSEYFAENQKGYNIHDEMSPRLSARAIAAHVVQGAEMAREYHLPKPIVDGILEHHGTCQIGFFYQQALEQQKHGDVREAEFRYPGPKPQRPETAILMICDASESGVRSIKNPNAERVREFVDKIIAKRAQDRQFDDCNLTLKQLDMIADVVTHRIMTSLHTRLAYPEPKPEPAASNVIPISGGSEG
jgi:hypothetical protein